MLSITNYTVEKLNDPTGILIGDRYEFYLHIDVPEDDELYTENGISLKVIYAVNGDESKIAQYYFIENNTEKYFDFALDEDEEEIVNSFCQENLPKD